MTRQSLNTFSLPSTLWTTHWIEPLGLLLKQWYNWTTCVSCHACGDVIIQFCVLQYATSMGCHEQHFFFPTLTRYSFEHCLDRTLSVWHDNLDSKEWSLHNFIEPNSIIRKIASKAQSGDRIAYVHRISVNKSNMKRIYICDPRKRSVVWIISTLSTTVCNTR